MYYKIKIEKIDRVPTVRRDWVKVADSGNKTDGGAVYEYVTYDGFETRTREVLMQEIETVDLPAVIRAINEL